MGAGFATGRELVLFFAGCPPSPVPWLIVSCLLIGVIAARGYPRRRVWGPPAPLFRAAAALVALAGLWLSWVTLVAMEAAFAHLLPPRAPWPVALAVSAAAIWAGAFWPAARGLARLAQLLGPFIAVALVGLALWPLIAPVPVQPARFAEEGGPGPARTMALSRCATHAALYTASNGLFARVPLLAVAAAARRPPLPYALAGGALLAGTAASTLWLVQRFNTSGLSMPVLQAAAVLHPWAYGLQMAVVTASVYTTAVAAVVSLGEWTAGSLKLSSLPPGTRRAVSAFWVLTALPAAALGFAEALARFYPLAGWVALAAIALEALFARLARRSLY